MSTQLRMIQSTQELEAMWPWAAPWLEKAILDEECWEDLGVIKSRLMEGTYQLWTAEEAPGVSIVFLVTEIFDEGNRKILALRWLGGRHREKWLHLLKAIEEIAKWNRVDGVEVYGRRGWEKVLRPLGYEFKSVLLSKRLNYSQSLN